MARQLKWWIGATVFSCAAVALLYLPPRGVSPEPRPRLRAFQLSAARLEAQRLADQWRGADQSVRLAEHRRLLEPELARRRATGQSGPTLLFGGTDTLSGADRKSLESALDTVWRRLGLGVTKVSVGVALDVEGMRPPASGDRPKRPYAGPAYLLPDSTDRATCVALMPVGLWIRRALTQEPAARDSQLVEWLNGGLGPCAFYAAYGNPGAPVGRWLAGRRYDIAIHRDWGRLASVRSLGWPLFNPPTKRWHWDAVYDASHRAVGCLAGRPDACRAAVLEGAEDHGTAPLPGGVAPEPWWWRRERLVQGDRYLADVAAEVGHDRFSRFWSSTLPVDTALASALKAPVGEWTERWQRRFAPRLPLGAPVPPSAVILGLLLAAAAVASVAVSISRREVR